MKSKKILLSLLLLSVSGVSLAHAYESRYVRDRDDRSNAPHGIPLGYHEVVTGLESQPYSQNDSHIHVIGWKSRVPLKTIVGFMQEGVTDQLSVLKHFSAPNVITRSPQDKETWVYHWLWSYENEYDPERAMIKMDHPAKRMRKNKAPVSMVITFNKDDVVESYSVKMLKVKKDAFDE